jgi:hypothetical protein
LQCDVKQTKPGACNEEPPQRHVKAAATFAAVCSPTVAAAAKKTLAEVLDPQHMYAGQCIIDIATATLTQLQSATFGTLTYYTAELAS